MRARQLTLAALTVATAASAGGFAVSDQDASASGRSGTAVGVSGTASSIHFNPAGLAGIEGASATAGLSALLPSASAVESAGGVTTSTVPGVKVPPHVYAAWGTGKFTLGAGFNAPFGGGLTWPDTWAGRTEIVEMQLQVLAGHLGGAWRFNDTWSAGASVTLASASLSYERVVDFVDSEGRALLGGNGLGVGGQLGVGYAPTKDVHLGLMGRLPVTMGLSGRAHFSSVPPAFAATLPDQSLTSTLTLPAKLAMGADVTLPWARVLADVEVTFWTSYQTFAVDFSDPATPDVAAPRNWANAPTFRLGAERTFGATVVRLGAVLDLAASPADTLSPSLPDSTRLGFSLGAGRAFGPVRADLAYQFIAFLPRAATGEAFPASYNANAHVLALSLSAAGFAPAPPTSVVGGAANEALAARGK